MAHTLHSEVLQHLHLLVGEGTGRSHHDRLARVDAQWVEVLHRSHREAMVVGIANDLKLYLFPTLEAFLYQHLGSECEG